MTNNTTVCTLLLAAFRKDFQKLGGGLVSLAKSFEFDERPGMLLRIIRKTRKLYEIYCSWFQESKMIVKLIYFGEHFLKRATFRPASTGLDHALMVACGLKQVLAEGSGCRWGAVGIPDHDSWWGPVG